MIPYWLHLLSILSLAAGMIAAVIVLADVVRDPQHMGIMNVVWPVVALFAPFVAVWAYYRYGKLAAESCVAQSEGDEPPSKTETPFSVMVGKGAAHCGSGCTLGDICAEWLAYLVPAVAVYFGWRGWFEDKIFAVWILDYCFAFVFGVVFQYFTIKPMRGLSPGRGLIEAVKADALSLTAWQVGMYGFMAVAHFWIFGSLLNAKLEVASFEFWFMMQIAMWFGFATAYPVNWWLIRAEIKEKM